MPGTRTSPSANVRTLVRAEEPSRVLHLSPFLSGALVPCHRSPALSSDPGLGRSIFICWKKWGREGRGPQAGGPTACPRLWVAGVPWDPNLGTVTKTVQEKWVWPRCAPKDQKEACTPLLSYSEHRVPVLGAVEMGP